MTTENQTTEQELLQLLTFILDNEVFAMDINQIQEVLEYTPVTSVPRTPDFMLGVINLRGSVVSVVDMRQQFGMTTTETTVDSCIVITEIDIDGEATTLGFLTDAVKEVIALDISQVSPPPRIGNKIDTNYIIGMVKYEGDFVIILDLPKIFSKVELEDLVSLSHESTADDNKASTISNAK